MLANLVKFVNPIFYVNAAKANYVKAVHNTAKSFREGSVAPLFKSMLIIGSVGYALEYYLDGRYHVAEKHAIIAEAMKNHGHH
eukprot:gene34289-41502_t